MEQHFYLRESKGPGAYLPLDYICQSLTKSPQKYSIPRNNRGLLKPGKHTSPGPSEYKPDAILLKEKTKITKMSKASRDVPFSKYASVHSELVRKGIY